MLLLIRLFSEYFSLYQSSLLWDKQTMCLVYNNIMAVVCQHWVDRKSFKKNKIER